MIKQGKTTYICDLCGTEFLEENKVKYHTVPGVEHQICDDYTWVPVAEPVHRHLCSDCYKRIIQVLKDNGIEFVDHQGSHELFDNIDSKYRKEKVECGGDIK